MLVSFTPICHLSKAIRIHTFVAHQRIRTIQSKASVSSLNDNNSLLQKTWTEEGSTIHFKNISLVNPKYYSKYFYNDLKLKFVDEQTEWKGHTQLLRNIAAKYDYWMVRNNQANLLYYRLEMMIQRLEYLKTVGLHSTQKLRQIQRAPPMLLYTFTNQSFKASLTYLRGLLDKQNDKYIHLFHPVTNRVTASKDTILDRIRIVENELQIKQPAVIRELLNMPCFFMDPSKLNKCEHLFIHKHSMPSYFDVDQHTAQILPPVCNLTKLKLSPAKHLSNEARDETISSLPSYNLKDILDVSYPDSNGKGTPECMSKFLVRAEFEEEKDRSGGQPMKGRRGFNMPPRQY